MSDSNRLTADEQEKLSTFIDITNWTGTPEGAIAVLRSVQWNIELAVSLHFDGSINEDAFSVPSVNDSVITGNPSISIYEELNSRAINDNIAPRVQPVPTYSPQHGTGFSIIQSVLLAPLNVGYKVFNTVFYFLSYLFPFLPRLTGYYPANRNATRSISSSSVDPKNVAARFIRAFEDNYGSNSIPFVEHGYTECLDQAKENLKYLVVVLESEEHDLTEKFNSNVLLNSQLLELLHREDIILWAGDVKESEPYQVANALGVTKFPFIALIAPSPKTATSSILVMTVLTKLQGCANATEIISSIEENIDAHSPKLMALVLDKREREMSRRLREEQDSAYERSLAADRERERKKREEAQRALEEEEVKQKLEAELNAKKHAKELWRKYRALQLQTSFKSSTEDSARISFRLTNGERVVQKLPGSLSLEDLYAFIDCYDYISGVKKIDPSDSISKPVGYDHEFAFRLVNPMPRIELEPDQGTQIRDVASLWPNGTVLVEITEDEGDDVEE